MDYNLRIRFFPRMQFSQNFKNHKNFRFTKITDKTNEKISLKSPKTLFFGPLVSFARWGFFQKNPALSHTSIYWPLTPCYVSGKKKKKMSQFRENLWTDGHTLFYRILPADAGGPTTSAFTPLNGTF